MATPRALALTRSSPSSGVNDPVAEKILSRVAPSDGKLTPPEDRTICTLFVGGVRSDITEDDLR